MSASNPQFFSFSNLYTWRGARIHNLTVIEALAGAAVIPGWGIYFPAHSHGSWLHSESPSFIKSSTYVQLGSSGGFLPESWRSKGLFSACTVLSPSVQESKYDSFKNSVGFLGTLLGVHTIRLKPHPQIPLNKVLLYFLFLL